MNVTWVLSNRVSLDPTIDIDQLKQHGAIWGSWTTWRAHNTDNVICHDPKKAQELIDREFHKKCNLYIPNSVYVLLGRPDGVRLYEGELNMDVDNKDELIALNLASTINDIILLLGFDWSAQPKNPDKLLEHRAHNYRNIVNQLLKEKSNVQWIMVDPDHTVRPEISKLPNFSTDSLKSVLNLLAS